MVETPAPVSPLESKPRVPTPVTRTDPVPPADTEAPLAAGGGDRLTYVPVGAVRPSPFQPRKLFDEQELRELAQSIERSGMIQPVIVRPADTGAGVEGDGGGAAYELVAGERRWRAAQIASLETIPAVVRELDDESAAEWALVENIQRTDLNAVERATALHRLAERFGLTQQEVAARVGMDRSSVANAVRLLDLEPEILDMIAAGELGGGHGKALLSFAPGPSRVRHARHAAANDLTVRQLEAFTRNDAELIDLTADQPGQTAEPKPGRSAAVMDLEKRLGDHLGTKVLVKPKGGGKKGELRIEYYSLDHFDDLMNRLGFQLDG